MTDDAPTDWSRTLRSCGDGGCILRDPLDRGQRTNGGCQHLKLDAIEMRRLARLLAAEVVSLRPLRGGPLR